MELWVKVAVGVTIVFLIIAITMVGYYGTVCSDSTSSEYMGGTYYLVELPDVEGISKIAYSLSSEGDTATLGIVSDALKRFWVPSDRVENQTYVEFWIENKRYKKTITGGKHLDVFKLRLEDMEVKVFEKKPVNNNNGRFVY